MPAHERRLIREKIKYPKITVGTVNCAGFDGGFPFEHVLVCGHLVTTTHPNEPCAPNCSKPVESAPAELARTTLGPALSFPFYCDACIEMANEPQIGAALDATQAENTRAILRHEEAFKRGKLFNFRQCHIAQKITSIPCDEEGDAVYDYVPSANAHDFDNAIPRTGANMFDNIDVRRDQNQKSKRLPIIETFESSSPDVSSSDTEAEDDVDDTVAEGAKWVQQQEELTTRRREERVSCILKEVLAVSSNKKHRKAKDRSGNLPVPKTSRDKSKIKNSGEGTLNSTSSQKMSRASKKKARKAQRKADSEKALEAKRKAERTQRKARKARRTGDGNDGRTAQIEARKDRKTSLKSVERSERRTMSSRGAAGHGINITPKVSKV